MELKKVSIKDKSELAELCIESYSKTCHDHWEDGGLAWYLEREFGDQRITLDLSSKQHNLLLLLNSKEITLALSRSILLPLFQELKMLFN